MRKSIVENNDEIIQSILVLEDEDEKQNNEDLKLESYRMTTSLPSTKYEILLNNIIRHYEILLLLNIAKQLQ